jgi:hypothetical protein
MMKTAITAAFLLIAGACTKEKTQPQLTGKNDTDSCKTVSVSFKTDILPAIATRCSGSNCHGAGSGQELTDYGKTKALEANIRIRVLQTGDMPPYGSPQLTSCEKSQLKSWLDSGSPNN